MSNKGNVNVKLGVDDKKLKKGLKDGQGQMKKFGSAVKKIGGIIAAAFAIKIIARWGKAALNAYREQRTAELKLATIMRDRMKLGEESFRNILKQTSAYQKQGVIGDEIQLAGAQQLATFVKQEQALKNLIPAMNNLLAQQKGYNAQAADAVNIANMMGRVLTGQVGSLSRVGISFTDVQEKILKTGTELEITATLAEVIADNVGNMNQELAKTDLGKIKSWNMFWGDMQEKLGKAIVPYLGDIATWAKTSVPKIRDGIIDIINAFIEWRNKSVNIRLAHKITFAYIKTGLLEIKIGWEQLISTVLFLTEAMKLGAKMQFGKIGDLWQVVQEDISETTKATKQEVVDIWRNLADDVANQDELWKKIGKSHGEAYSEGVGESKTTPSKPEFKGRGLAVGIDTGLADASGVLDKNTGLHKNLASAIARTAKEQEALNIATEFYGGVAISSIEGVGKAMANAARESIKASLAQMLAKVLVSVFETVPFPFNLAAAAGAGAGASALFDRIVPSFAQGGAAFGPTMAVVGEAPGISRSNPEYIGTAKQLGMGNHITVDDIYLEGDIIRIALKATNDRRSRTGI